MRVDEIPDRFGLGFPRSIVGPGPIWFSRGSTERRCRPHLLAVRRRCSCPVFRFTIVALARRHDHCGAVRVTIHSLDWQNHIEYEDSTSLPHYYLWPTIYSRVNERWRNDDRHRVWCSNGKNIYFSLVFLLSNVDITTKKKKTMPQRILQLCRGEIIPS